MGFIVIQAVLPDYRVGLFRCLSKNGLKLVIGDTYFTETVVSVEDISGINNLVIANNYFFFNRKMLIQHWNGLFSDLTSDVVRVVELNPRCLVTVLSLLLSKFFGRGKTVVWGHLYNRNGKLGKYSVRRLLLSLADGALFYTKGQQEQYLKHEFLNKKTCGYAPNSVLYQNQIESFTEAGSDFIYVGRLVKDKKPVLMVQAFIKACKQGLDNSALHIVGDGPEFTLLKELIDNSNYTHRIKLYGHNNDYDFLKSLYKKSVCSISPGYVGLSITQSFSFGRPMLISETEPHSPELEAFITHENGEYFETDNVDDLATKISAFYNSRDEWLLKAPIIAELVAKNYTYESMAAGFLDLVLRVENKK